MGKDSAFLENESKKIYNIDTYHTAAETWLENQSRSVNKTFYRLIYKMILRKFHLINDFLPQLLGISRCVVGCLDLFTGWAKKF